MSIEEVSAEKLAELFHHYHHTLGSQHSGTTTVDARRHFAKPGEAEWGC
jgi:hypothetical protein